MNTGFDLLAPVYDSLTRLIFGKSIITSQTWFLNQIPANAKVLILGGGTGWLLEELLTQNPLCKIWYIEASSNMMERTRERAFYAQVNLIQGTEKDIPTDILFDTVITNFYLDMFSENKLRSIARQITNQSTLSTQWIITDFEKLVWWHRWMLKIMYLFFRAICSIEARCLPDWPKELLDKGWIEMSSKSWYGKFIKSTVWHRS